eukprot:gene1724-493_t
MNFIGLFLLFTVCVITAQQFTDDNSGLVQYTLRSEQKHTLNSLNNFKMFEVHSIDENTVELIGEKRDEEVFKRLGFQIVNKVPSQPFEKINGPAGYTKPQEILETFKKLESTYPKIVKLISLQKEYNLPKTIDGNELFALKISEKVSKDRDVPNRLIVSNHHARELITPELALDSAKRLVSGYESNDKTIKDILKNNQIYIMFTQNPDGLNYVWSTNNWWRKNRKRNSDGSYGVDLNRNYDAGWNLSCGGSSSPRSEIYKGTSAASEIETQTMVVFQTERNFASVLDYHSYAREVRINYGRCTKTPPKIDALFQTLGSKMAVKQNYRRVYSCCTGGDISYAYMKQGSWANLVETGTAFQPRADLMKAELVRVWPGTLENLATPIPLSGHVIDASTKKGIKANFKIEGLTFVNNEQRYSNKKRKGRYHLWLPTGRYVLELSADGYKTTKFEVDLQKEGMVQDFELKK